MAANMKSAPEARSVAAVLSEALKRKSEEAIVSHIRECVEYVLDPGNWDFEGNLAEPWHKWPVAVHGYGRRGFLIWVHTDTPLDPVIDKFMYMGFRKSHMDDYKLENVLRSRLKLGRCYSFPVVLRIPST